MRNLGMKQISPQNWLEPDEPMNFFVSISSNGDRRAISGEEWLGSIFEAELTSDVPEEIRSLFEVARGSMVYGYFFYPLFTLAMEQLFRVEEAAVAQVFAREGGPGSRRSFKKRLDWLEENGRLSDRRYRQLDAARRLRNGASHPETQSIFPPNTAIDTLHIAASILNELFAPPRRV